MQNSDSSITAPALGALYETLRLRVLPRHVRSSPLDWHTIGAMLDGLPGVCPGAHRVVGTAPPVRSTGHTGRYCPSSAPEETRSAICSQVTNSTPREATSSSQRSRASRRWPRPITSGCMVTVRTPSSKSRTM